MTIRSVGKVSQLLAAQLPKGVRPVSLASGLDREPLSSIRSLGSNELSGRVEKLIDDVKKGRNNPGSKKVFRELNLRAQQAADGLAKTDPNALLLYNGVLSSLDFDKKARFVQGVGDGIRRAGQIQDAARQLNAYSKVDYEKALSEAPQPTDVEA